MTIDMTKLDPILLILIVTPLVTVVVWLIRLEGRLNLESSRISAVADDVRYIRGRIDDALKRTPNAL